MYSCQTQFGSSFNAAEPHVQIDDIWYAWGRKREWRVFAKVSVCMDAFSIVCVCVCLTHRRSICQCWYHPGDNSLAAQVAAKSNAFLFPFPPLLSSLHYFWFWKVNVNSFVKRTLPQATLLKYIFCNLSDLLSGRDFFPLLGMTFHLDSIIHLSYFGLQLLASLFLFLYFLLFLNLFPLIPSSLPLLYPVEYI